MRRILAGLYRGWMAFAHALGRAQTILVLSAIYFIVIGIMAPLARLFSGDPLDRRLTPSSSNWIRKARTNQGLADAHRLF